MVFLCGGRRRSRRREDRGKTLFAEGVSVAEDVVVVLGEAVGFVADVLEKAECGVVAREGEGLFAVA